ncbi:MAG: T9SS type A sorting domain-containing protein [Planctomycetes bacterium]|nr:T9SS type A sorting domain-containing protein [Planctomycetota bacterium]
MYRIVFVIGFVFMSATLAGLLDNGFAENYPNELWDDEFLTDRWSGEEWPFLRDYLLSDTKRPYRMPAIKRIVDSVEMRQGNHAAQPTEDEMTVLGEWKWGSCFGVEPIDDQHIALRNGSLFQVMDISDPANPQIIGEVELAGSSFDIDISGNYAYLAGNGLTVIDISDLSQPVIVGEVRPGISYYFVEVDPRGWPYVYLGDIALSVVDVSDPANPVLIGDHITVVMWGTMEIYMDEEQHVYVYAPDWAGLAINVVDVTDPENPVRSGVLTLGTETLTISNDLLITGGVGWFSINSLEDPLAPQEIARVDELYDWGARMSSMTVVDSLLYLGIIPASSGDTMTGVMPVDISDPHNPLMLDIIEWPGMTAEWPGPPDKGVYLSKMVEVDETIWVSAGIALWGIDISDTSALQTSSYFPTPGSGVLHLLCQGDYLYAAFGHGGLWILDISDLSQPTHIGHFSTPGYLREMVIYQSIAYLRVHYNLLAVDISDPTQPTYVGALRDYCTSSGSGYGEMDAIDNYLYLPTPDEVLIIDIEQPDQIEVVGSYPLDQVSDVTIAGDLAFLATTVDNNGLNILDISSPLMPEEVGFYSQWKPKLVEIRWPYAFVATVNVDGGPGYNGFAILDVVDPHAPVEVGRIDTLWTFGSGSPGGLVISESWAYRCRSDTKVIDIDDPYNPEIVTTIPYPPSLSVCLCGTDGGRDVIAHFRRPGLIIYRNDLGTAIEDDAPLQAQNTILFQNYPNPWQAKSGQETKIRFQLPVAGMVELIVYNTNGQRIKTLIRQKQLPEGNHTVSWDGRNDRGKTVAGGIYLYRLKANGEVHTRRMILMQ